MEKEYRITIVEYSQVGEDFYAIQEKRKFLFFNWWSTKWERDGDGAFPLYFHSLIEATEKLVELKKSDYTPVS